MTIFISDNVTCVITYLRMCFCNYKMYSLRCKGDNAWEKEMQ